MSPLRVTSVIASLTSGGIGPVCRYAAESMAKLTDWQVTLLSLHDPVGQFSDETGKLQIVHLGLGGNCARLFLSWLSSNPQDLVVSSDVSRIESAYRFLPSQTRHVIQIHDSGRRYREVAVRNAACVDGVVCVGQHIEAPLRRSLEAANFQGLLRVVHNGANFPPIIRRKPNDGPLRLLFMGRVEALKGVFDLVPLLKRLKRLDVPVKLSIVGGENEALRRQFQRNGLDSMVTWTGRVSHEQCYAIAAESDIFLMTSRKEPFGMVTIEAMGMGCVPIAYNIPSGSTEIIEQGKSGLLVPLGDIHTWAEHVVTLHHERQRLSELSASAVDRARKFFNAEVMGQNMANFISDVMTHAESNPAKRELGLPPETAAESRASGGYQRLPAGLREWIRNRVHTHPKVSNWLLSR